MKKLTTIIFASLFSLYSFASFAEVAVGISANFASISLMAKQNLDFNHYDQAVRFLNQAREAMRGSSSSFSLENL